MAKPRVPSFITNNAMRNVASLKGADIAWCKTLDNRTGTVREVLKAYKADGSEPYARWKVKAYGPMTGGESMADYGDEYVANVTNAELIEVEGREPTREELEEWHNLRHTATAPGWAF